MEFNQKQLLELKRYSTMGILNYLDQALKEAKELTINAENGDDLAKVDIHLENSLNNYKNYIEQLDPETYFKNRKR